MPVAVTGCSTTTRVALTGGGVGVLGSVEAVLLELATVEVGAVLVVVDDVELEADEVAAGRVGAEVQPATLSTAIAATHHRRTRIISASRSCAFAHCQRR